MFLNNFLSKNTLRIKEIVICIYLIKLLNRLLLDIMMKKKVLLLTIGATSLVVAAAATIGILVSKNTNKMEVNSNVKTISKDFENGLASLVLNAEDQPITKVLTDQEQVDEVAFAMISLKFKKKFPTIDFDEVIASTQSISAVAKLNYLKWISAEFNTFVNKYPQVEFEITEVYKNAATPLSATVTLKRNDASRKTLINFSNEIASNGEAINNSLTNNSGSTTHESNVVNPNHEEVKDEPVLSDSQNLSDRQIIGKLTSSLNNKVFISNDTTARTDLVYAKYLFSNSTEKQLDLLRQYADIPKELTSDMVVSLVVAQPSKMSDTLIVEIVFKKGVTLGVAAFRIVDFLDQVEEFDMYSRQVNENLRLNPITVKANHTAKTFFDNIKDLDYANQLYEIAKISDSDSVETKEAFANLLYPIPAYFGVIPHSTVSLVDSKDEDSEGYLLITTSATFNGLEKITTAKIGGFLTAKEFSNLNPGDRPKISAQYYADLFKSALKIDVFNVSLDKINPDWGYNHLRHLWDFIDAKKDLTEQEKVDQKMDIVKQVITNQEFVDLLNLAEFSDFSYVYRGSWDINTVQEGRILSISFKATFKGEPDVVVDVKDLFLNGEFSFALMGGSTYRDGEVLDVKPDVIKYPNVEIDNFIDVERRVNVINKVDIMDNRGLLAILKNSDEGRKYWNLDWKDVKIQPVDDKSVDTVKVTIFHNDPKYPNKLSEAVFILKFTNPIHYKNVSVKSYFEAVDVHHKFLLITKNRWLRSRIIGLYITTRHEIFMGWKPSEIDVPQSNINQFVWDIEDKQTMKDLGKDGVMKVLQSRAVSRIYLYPSKGTKFLTYTGIGIDIIMHDKDGNVVPYSVPGFGRDILSL
ncbi:hypothetical protein ACA758_01865 [Mycoplasmopsis agassizii]|uniref:hypothetical protein n=1 Tax=Mycoplasmopsis agassizii TaxID=33922 RepID=UPI003528B504